MKKALIIVSSCLLVAIVALIIITSRLNGQKADLTDQLDVSSRTLTATVEEAQTYQQGLT